MHLKTSTAAILASALLFSGCSQDSTQVTATNNAKKVETVEIVDAQKRTVKVPKNPKTIVTTDFSVLQTLADLDVDVAGVADPVALPDALSKYKDPKKSVGSLFEPNYEKIATMKPDLIIIGGRSGKNEILDEMLKITPNVIDMTARPKDSNKKFDEAFQRITDIAKIVGKEDAAEAKISTLKNDMAELQKKAKASGVSTTVVQVTGPKVSAYGPGSRFGYVYEQFGFKAIEAPVDEKGSHGQEVSQELFAKYNPGIIFYLDRGKTIGRKGTPAKEVLTNKFVAESDASKNDKLIEIDGFAWYIATNAPTSIEKMIKDAHKAL